MLQGGLHPDLGLEYYSELLTKIKKQADIVVHSFSPAKISADDWLAVMRAAHGLGLKTTASMLCGHIETPHRAEHLDRLRCLQDETGGFRAFILWSYQPGNTALGGTKTSAWDHLRTLAAARLYLDNSPTSRARGARRGNGSASSPWPSGPPARQCWPTT